MTPQIPDKEQYLLELLVSLGTPWPDNRTVNIVCHGHSVPAGYFATPLVNSLQAYPQLLLAGLKERFPNALINVIVSAKGGENSESGSSRLAGDVLNHKPDLVTIDYALNDRGIGLERAGHAWRQMIETLLANQVKVILMTPTLDLLTRRTGDPLWSAELPLHAAQVVRLAEEYQVALADSYRAFNDYLERGGELADLLSHVNHPNVLGHTLVARELLRWFPAQ